MNTFEVRVTRKAVEAQDICSFELSSIDGGRLPAFSAGAHIDVHIGAGTVRQYSLCNDPEESHRYLIAVLRDPDSRGGSIGMHERIAEGDVIRISEPKNHFPLVPAKRTLLFAGGIGVTPLLCMAERLARTGADFDLHYCARSRERTAFLERIAAAPFAGRVHVHLDDGTAQQKLDLPGLLATPADDTHLYVCGPAGFIGFVTGTAQARGWASGNVHVEFFGAQPQATSGDTVFEICIASNGQRYTVPPDKPVIRVLEENGIFVPVSCEQGVCGTCITRVLDGTPDHRDLYFTDEEKAVNDQFTPCCSRAKSACLVLDL